MSQRADARSAVLVTTAGRVVCRAVGTTASAVLADIVLDAEADAEERLIAATNVRSIAVNLRISKDTAARALGPLVDAGLVIRHRRRGACKEFSCSLYELRLHPGGGVTLVAPTPCPTSPCPVFGDTDAEAEPDARPGAEVNRGARPDGASPGRRRGQRRSRRGQEALFELSADAVEGSVSSDVFAIAVDADVDPPAARVPAHRSDHQAVSNHTRKVPHPAHTDTDDLTTTAPSAPDRLHDQLTTTATTIASTIASTTTDHHQNRFRHWHPAVPFPGATVPATGEGAGAAPC